MKFTRRVCLALVVGSVAAGAAVTPGAADDSGISVLVATNEPYGTYHIASMVDHVESEGGRIALVSPDHEHASDDGVDVVTLDEAEDWGADLLVVNGATEWPVTVIEQLDDVDVVASSLAYLQPVEAELAAQARPRLVGATAQSSDEAEVFAAHLGIDPGEIAVVGNPQLDDLPPYEPEPGTVLIATSVTHPDETGDAAPGTQLLLDTAAGLEAEGYRIRVGLHPREDPELWSDYEIATEGTLRAATTAEAVVGIPGSIFPQIAAFGAPLVGILDPELNVPDYLLDLAARAHTTDEALEAVEAGWTPDPAELEAVVGPVGGSKERLWDYWVQAAQGAETPSPTPSDSTTPTPEPTPSDDTDDPEQPGLPETGVAGAVKRLELPVGVLLPQS